MSSLKFNPINAFSYYCVLGKKRIGRVFYSPTDFYSWVFRPTDGNVETFGSTKLQAVKAYLSIFAEPPRTCSSVTQDNTPKPPSPVIEVSGLGSGSSAPLPAPEIR